MVSKEFVEERMKEVLPKPEKVDLEIPTALTDTGFDWKYELYQNKKIKRPAKGEPWPKPELNDKYEMPRLWNLRPHRYANTEEILAEIARLEIDDGWTRKFWSRGRRGEAREYHIPQVIGPTNANKSFWLAPDGDSDIDRASSFRYRGREIVLNGEDDYTINSVEPLSFRFFGRPNHPLLEWSLDGRYEGSARYPEKNVWDDLNLPNWQRPLSLVIDFTSFYVYGKAYLGLKQLGFWGALDMCINFIEGVEWSYDVGGKPEWI